MSYDPTWIDVNTRRPRRRRGRRAPRMGNPRSKVPSPALRTAKMALAKASQLERFMEDKYYDFAASITALDRDGDLSVWNPIPQGDTDITRDGDYLFMKHVEIRASVWHDPQTGNQGASAGTRFILFYDKQNTIASVDDLLDTSGADETNMLSPIIWDNRKQVQILLDVMINADGVWKERVLCNWFVKLNKQTQFSAGSTNITTGALKGLLISDRASTDTYLPQFHYYYRIVFKDA